MARYDADEGRENKSNHIKKNVQKEHNANRYVTAPSLSGIWVGDSPDARIRVLRSAGSAVLFAHMKEREIEEIGR